jgi:hypothetical protein
LKLFCALALTVGALAAATAHADDGSRQRRERAEVRAIFAILLTRMTPGDGLHFSVTCVFD